MKQHEKEYRTALLFFHYWLLFGTRASRSQPSWVRPGRGRIYTHPKVKLAEILIRSPLETGA
jgi:phosphatidylserine decarboxylase